MNAQEREIETFERLGRIEGKLDAFVVAQGRQEKELERQDARIHALETSSARRTGIAATISLFFGAAVSWFLNARGTL